MSIFFWRKKKDETAANVSAQQPEPAAPVEEPVQEEMPAEEPVPAEEPAVEEPAPVEEPAEEPAAEEEPVQDETPVEEPVPVEEPAEEPTAEEEPEEAPAEEPEPAEESVEEPAPVEEPAEEESAPAEEPVEEPVPVEEPEEEPAAEEEPEEAPAEEPEPAEESVEEPAPEEEPAPVPVQEVKPAPEPVREQSYVPPTPPVPPVQDDEEEEEDERPRRRGRAWLWIFLLLCVIGGSYYYGMTYSQTHFLENTYINGMDVSNMTAPEVEKILSQKAEGYELRIRFRDGEEEVIPGTAIGFKVKPDGSVDRILSSQDHKKWFMCFFRRTDGNVEQKTTYDPTRLDKAVTDLPELSKESMVKPVDAYIELNDKTFSIVPEVEGNWIAVGKVKAAAHEAVKSEGAEVDVVSLDAYKEPKVRAKDDDIVEKCAKYNKMLAGSITWDLPNGETLTVDADTTKNWLSVDKNGNYYRDEDLWEDNIEFWVDELARNVNTVGKDWNFHATNVGDITVSGGDYGYSVDKVTEREEVWDLLWDGETDERDPYFYQTQYTRGSGIGGTYIEANLSQQHVYIYIDGVMVCDTPCVSGNVSLGRGTPTGVYQILYKDTDTDLKGIPLGNGQYSYVSHVDYWMPFYSGCGFHDASWRSNFGGSIYRSDGSHGCINLPPSIAPTFYNYVRTGMPVVVFY